MAICDRRGLPIAVHVASASPQIDLAAVPEVLGEALQQPIEAVRALPELEATMASLVRRIARWRVVPRRARAQDPGRRS